MTDIERLISGKTPELPKTSQITIEVIEGNDQGAKFVLSRKARVSFGRGGDVDVVLNDPMIASHHAVIEVYGEVIVVQDVKSATGVFVNDAQVKASIVGSGDKIRLGGTLLKVTVSPK